jgi:anthranilate phosphoribosyltransferase
VLEHLIGGTHFSEEEAEAALQLLLKEENEARISAFLVLLRAKGETFEEVRARFLNWLTRCQKWKRNLCRN